jgi:hypothetical protein
MASPLITDRNAVTCALCLDIFEMPRRISCGHIFCLKCLEQYIGNATPQCPVCRQTFDPRNCQTDEKIENLLRTKTNQCEGCKKQVYLNQLRAHAAVCEGLKNKVKEAAAKLQIQNPHVDTPNRHTFQCPYCTVKHLDSAGLVKHCNEQHSGNRSNVVCPICASMPWGDPNFRSTNFIRHLNTRHRFEYDTYVDYQQDDDDMLQAAIQASMSEK